VPTAGPLIKVETDYLRDVNVSFPALLPATLPSRTQYVTWMATALADGFDSAPASINESDVAIGGQLVAEESRLSRWLGNIWLRQVRFVLAA